MAAEACKSRITNHSRISLPALRPRENINRHLSLPTSCLLGGNLGNSNDAQLLFRSDYGNALLDKPLFAVDDAHPAQGTEESFHSSWDNDVRKVLDPLLRWREHAL